MSELEFLQFISLKMFYAVLCGTFVGVERKINDSSAGFKTQILICVGAMLFTVMPVAALGKIDGDNMRVMAQIVSGVGFLGAGAILHGNTQHIVGLTTAAWIWFTAAIGVMIGVGHGAVAVFTTLTLVAVITVARKFEHKIFSSRVHNFLSGNRDLDRKTAVNGDDKNAERSPETKKVA